MAVLVVDLARFFVGERFVGVGDLDELLFGGVVVAVIALAVVEVAEKGFIGWRGAGDRGTNGFLSGWYFLLSWR